MQIHFQYSATVSKSTSPCILQTEAYDQLHLEMMHLGEKRELRCVCWGGTTKTAIGIEQLKVKSNLK